MARITNTDSVLKDNPDPVDDQIKADYARAVRILLEAANDESRPGFATLHLVSSLADALERVVHATYASGGLDRLVNKQPLSISGGSDRPAPQLDALRTHADALAQLSQGQQDGRGMLISQVVDGTFAVEDDGTPAIQKELDGVRSELAEAKRDKAVAEAKAKTLESQLNASLKGIDPEISTAWTLLSDPEKATLRKPIMGILEGHIKVNADGTIGAHKALFDENTILKSENASLKKQVDDLGKERDNVRGAFNAFIKDVNANSRDSLRSKTVITARKGLSDTSNNLLEPGNDKVDSTTT